MKKQNSLTGFLLVGLGLYFLIRQFNIPFLSQFYSWPTLLIIVGVAFLLHSYLTKDYANIFTGALLLGFGIHFHGLNHFPFWIDHWSVYLLIIGIAILLRYQKTKSGLIPALILVGLGLFALLVPTTPSWFTSIQMIFQWIERFWPVVLILFGFYMLKKN
ncbi:LiaI-LiaF-like domain-containing protein [Halobacillus mangrovi]|uniref:LiaI-LiaF-like transmembrane region domain-containing protein n=1 Tax=Halobacillus mangrovi TaxID=402384 RepID=A0A1W5ZUE0_9BACI|nr:DUF5668 domain-containing protein [Halobacillus mangrovi]ARI76908.1 hypothetical protein HM131_08675 [Halobacillus mangrovi]